MKLVKSLAIGALAVASISSSFATTLKVTGSTAYRKALYAAVVTQLGASTKAVYVGSALNGANQAMFTNGTDTVVCCMAGSVGGVNWVSNGGNVAPVAPFDPSYSTAVNTAWLKQTLVGAAASVVGGQATGGTQVGTKTSTVPVADWDVAGGADFTMSDSLQASTPAADQVHPMVAAAGGNLGVVEFMFAKGTAGNVDAAAYARFTNMTALGFQNLAASGNVGLAAFTGNALDKTTQVVLVGRDSDSGTRLAVAYETGLNDVNAALNQYLAFDSSANDVGLAGAGTVADAEFAADTLSGYSSGSQVKNVLNAPVSATATLGGTATKFVFVGYVGTGDKPTATTQYLTYNGVAWDSTGAATQLGQYTFWTYEQGYYLSSLATAKKTLAEAVAAAVKPLAGSAAGVTTASMLATRASEGQVVNVSY
jgi:hypothetical protein